MVINIRDCIQTIFAGFEIFFKLNEGQGIGNYELQTRKMCQIFRLIYHLNGKIWQIKYPNLNLN